MEGPHLLICGAPASGKTTFGRWLAREKGFVHIDFEAPPSDPESLERCGLRPAWDAFTGGGSGQRFAEALNGHGRSVLTWGFPVECVPLVQRLRGAGLRVAWFEGERLASRELFQRRGTGGVAGFDAQFSAIAQSWPSIEPLCSRIVHTVQPCTPMPAMESLFAEVFGESA